MASELAALTDRLIAFRDARDWKQFHALKDLILSVSIEAGELLELVQWQTQDTVETIATEPDADPDTKARIAEECADVLIYLLLVCERAGIDLAAATQAKIDLNEQKYPVEKARGRAIKYDKL